MGMTISAWSNAISHVAQARWAAMTAHRWPTAPNSRSGSVADEFSSAFEQFFLRYEPRITGYLWRMVGDEATACDLCQETFIRAWQHFTEVQAAQNAAAWLFRVATNLALNHIRSRSRGVRAAVPLDFVDDPAGSDPSSRFAEQEYVQQILTELSPKARALLILRDVYQVSFEEIETLLGLSSGAARMALSRARAQFRDRYLQKEAC